ncbi:hypothetical protein JHN55_05935 [Streptomyces sp. MBT56]|uniref:hypothetical protein n=1 Tax=unclassified Streptomyces TaxID=2593676 RepID=UPI00190B7079|nr:MULTISPECIES: hypothetical protein [unclassified Streptomyces]MBK3556084.1 hypothetical protein [Streptomyces sp. MBT56]MBK3605772.1 hypothetical protein [Streptomyces sp. MBT54]MBK3618296.1 hypothetical protein [Streptomyces sp. MBT98]
MTEAAEAPNLHMAAPSVYLDLWVWIRLARAANGAPREASDTAVLTAVRDASAVGVVFPLSATHYTEIGKITDPRQRTDLARIMASVSHCRTMRSRRVLLRHQMLHAMHVSFGRPTFRPSPPRVLGIGAAWALVGERAPLVLRGPSGRVDMDTVPELRDLLRKANQYAEFQLLAGPRDEEIEDLRRLGYRPEAVREVTRSRLELEETYAGMLADDPVSRHELRVRIQAREILHEHHDLLQELLAEYRIDLHREIGLDPNRPRSGRPRMTAFVDRMPSVRIAVDLKAALFSNQTKTWTVNALFDVDALGIAVPYCHVVVPDREMANLLSRSHAGPRSGTRIVTRLRDLPGELAELQGRVSPADGGSEDADWVAPDEDFCTEIEDLHALAPRRSPRGIG